MANRPVWLQCVWNLRPPPGAPEKYWSESDQKASLENRELMTGERVLPVAVGSRWRGPQTKPCLRCRLFLYVKQKQTLSPSDPGQKSRLEGRSRVKLPLLLVRVGDLPAPGHRQRPLQEKGGHNLCTPREGGKLGPVTVLYQEKAEICFC